MIFGHDFKYCIPEMDRLLGAAADIGIHFEHDSETVHKHERGEYLIQIVTGGLSDQGETKFQLMVTAYNAQKREEEII